VAALGAIGVPLVIDDFGTGYSSLAYLKRLRPAKLKIDRSFIQDLPDNADDRALTLAILRIAQALQIDVVAEGVETALQRAFLAQNGCTLMQGWLAGRALTADEFTPLLRNVAPV
jgi:EAL domain-containing protein (putative c-di-GMP-specific phosphodiesterase class I)